MAGTTSPPEDKGYAQVSQESISTWAECVGIADLSSDISKLLASDVTYRVRQTLHLCLQHLHACKRRRLTPDDFNRVLRWMDVPPVLGHSGCMEGPEWLHVPEVGVHIVQDNPLSLASTAVRGDIYHQPGNPCVKGEWSYITNHVSVKGEGGTEGSLAPLSLAPQLNKYYNTLMSAIFGHSNTAFQRMEEDLLSNPNVGPLVGAVVSGCLRGAQIARQNPCILRRVLLVVRAMLANSHMHVGHAKYVRDIMSLIVFCVVTERKQSYDTHPIRSLATNTMLKVLGEWSEGRSAWEVAVSSLGGVIASTSRPWSQHCGALSALLALGPPAQVSLMQYYSSYNNRLEAALSSAASHPYITSRDTMDAKAAQATLMAVLVKIAISCIRSLPDSMELTLRNKKDDEPEKTAEAPNCKKEGRDSSTSSSSSNTAFDPLGMDFEDQEDIFKKLQQVYTMGESWFGSAFVLQIPGLYLCYHKNLMPSFMESHIYKEMQTTGEALLKDMLNREENDPPTTVNKRGKTASGYRDPFSKRAKLENGSVAPTSYDLSSDVDFATMDFESLIEGTQTNPRSLESIFSIPENASFYKVLPERNSQFISINLQNCCAWENYALKRPKGLMPRVVQHKHRHLFNKSKSFISKMPHCKFTRPLQPKVMSGFFIHQVIL